jgi:hypothetical protein
MDRTGVVSGFRLCPRHRSPLELSVQPHGTLTNIAWWCGECGGEWSELYFTMLDEARLPLKALSRRFFIRCPSCSGNRSQGTCSCCFLHRCLECGGEFDIEFRKVKESLLPPDQIEVLRNKVWLDENTIIEPSPRDVEHFPAVLLERRCESHPETPLYFTIDHAALDERRRFGWFCKDCGDIPQPDYCEPIDKRSRTFFCLTEHPHFRCWACNHVEFDQSDDLLDATCVTCGTIYRLDLQLVAYPDSRS